MTLTELAAKFGCDKLHSHSYVPFYEELFVGRAVRRLLEIGIGFRDLMEPFVPFYVHGASLRMWEEYFPEARIFGCDLREDTLFRTERIHTFVCDQSSARQCDKMAQDFGSAFDVIIDDGSHQTEHQITSAIALLPHLNTPGTYLIEDVREPDAVFLALLDTVRRIPGATMDVHLFNKRADDCIVAIEKKL